MNILFVTYSAYPRIGGRSTYMTILKRSLEELDHRVDILCHAPELNEIRIIGKQRIKKMALRQKLQQKIERLIRASYPNLSQWILLRETERYIYEEAIRQLDLSGYDLIHSQDIFSSMACYRAGVRAPLIATFHNCKVAEWKVNELTEYTNPLEAKYIAREEYLSLMRSEIVIVPSQWLQQSFEQLGIPPQQLRRIAYGINIDQFKQRMKKQTELLKPKDRTLIICPARLVPIKGHTYLLAALQKLQAKNKDFECWIIGNGVLEDQLKKEALERNLSDKVLFLGGRDDLPALMALADIVVLPTLHDTFPFVILEAQLAGTPVISTKIGGVPEMITHRDTGLLGPPADVDYLYYSLRKLLEKPALGQEIAQRARVFAEAQWSDERMAKEILEAYQELLQSRLQPDHDLLGSLKQTAKAKSDAEGGTIRGQAIRNKTTNEPVIVHLVDISWITVKSAQCDLQGRFSFSKVPAGKYGLKAVQGEKIVSGHVVVREGAEVIWNPVLE